MKTTQNLRSYIQNKDLSVEMISRKTGVAREILSGEVARKMNASEFLAVCSYLQVDPYQFEDEQDLQGKKQ